MTAPAMATPSRYHWLAEALLDVSSTPSPGQNVVGPPAEIDGDATEVWIVISAVLPAVQPEATVVISVSVVVPDGPAMNVTVCAVAPAVIVPLAIDQAYASAPAVPVAVLPAA